MKQSDESVKSAVSNSKACAVVETPLVASRLTAELPAAIATIVVEGTEAIPTVQHLVQLKAKTLDVGNIHYGLWTLANNHSEQVVVCATTEQSVEIHCHGGHAICQAILDDLKSRGCHILRSTEWQARRATRDRSTYCPLAYAAEQDLLLAQTERAAAILLDQFDGALRSQLEHVLAELETDNLRTATNDIDRMLDLSQIGLHLTVPWRVVLAGPPNVGKSSLSNTLVGQTHAIVHSEPGTTRDWLETTTAIDGWPVSLTDTAGIRISTDEIEVAGITRAHQQLTRADVVLLVVDGTIGWTTTHQRIYDELDPATTGRLIVWNKADIASPPSSELFKIAPVIEASSMGEPGVQALIEVLGNRICLNPPKVGEAVPFRAEHVERLHDARRWLIAGRGDQAQTQLRSLLAVPACEQKS